MRVLLLGTVQVESGGRQLSLGGPKPRGLLAVLAANAGQVVSLDQLVDALWDDVAAVDIRGAVYTYVSTLRRELGDVLVRSAGGYVLDLPPEDVDVLLFDRHLTEGRRAGDPATAAERLRAGLELWRGTPLTGVQGRWAEGERARLGEQRLAALEDRLAAELALGWGNRLVGEITALTAEHPLRERLHAHRVTALTQAGRRAEALAHFRAVRRELADELGVDPGPELTAAHERALRADAGPGEPAPVPAQLPTDVADFTGRAEDVRVLTAVLTARPGAAVPVCAVSGQPGAGKSTLARHVAHLVRDGYPDGQLYAALSGTRPVVAEPAEVLGGFLRALGVPETSIPPGLDDRVTRFRSELAGRRVLLVLDDAADERQVRPLLPGAPGCAVLVTSRNRLSALEGAHQRDLRVLPDAEALQLLDVVVGDRRVAREPAAAAEITRLCGRLPLAVRIAGARLAARPHWPLAKLANRLRAERSVLAELSIGDLEVRGSLALSYHSLAERERTALRRLGFLEVPSFAPWLLVPLLDCPADVAEEVLERLVDCRLVDVGAGERYVLHDLTRAFGRERAVADEPVEDLKEAVARVAEDYLTLVQRASTLIPSTVGPAAAPVSRTSRLDEALVDELLGEPGLWFDREQSGLVAVVELTSELDLSGHAARLAAALSSSTFALTNQFSLWWRTHQAALASAQRTGDRGAEGRLLCGLGWLRYEQDRLDEAADYYRRALDAWTTAGDLPSQIGTRLELGRVYREQGDLRAAAALLAEAIPVLELMDEPGTLARAYHAAALTHTELGELEAALDACGKAMDGYTGAADEHGVAHVLRSIGLVHRAAGRLDEAAANCDRALQIFRSVGDRLMSAYATQSLAKIRLRQGLGAAVRRELAESLETCNDMQDSFGQALILRTLGELELSEGDPGAAKQLLNRALAWWEALNLPLWRGRTLRDLSVVLAAEGDGAGADRAWAEARELFERHGSREAGEARPVPRPSQKPSEGFSDIGSRRSFP
ncbi:AfsR/SARP family transcriptional regulator [Amycolatopsis tolypomycina]|uniref:DNA-binding transcriptional activator of the SARP family n=1 Tax=Amycolatopsis tolypomycina TaxID=208445 RepID=A0A1H5A2C6_9PSEU|nr:BTAD domain-containing putative transcriptional regulator [Amycolatopsis tolypomycina]SED36499.1 DNA-binding transcriptional activator of the SARP family [Amycolatopsis tolypomycina]